MAGLPVTLADTPVELHPERGLFWPAKKTLFIADLHIGKAAAFRAAAIPIPGGTTSRDLDRLTTLLQTTSAERLVVLGDLLHARTGRHEATLQVVSDWRARHLRLEIVLVMGNHDRHAGDPPVDWSITVCEEFHEGPFIGRHEPEASPDGHVLAGHIHPVIRLTGLADQSERLACFHCRPDLTVLPAFGGFTGGGRVALQPGDAAYAIAGDAIIPCSARQPRPPRWTRRGRSTTRPQ